MQTFIHVNCTKLSSEAATFADWPKRPLFADASVLARVGVAVAAVVAAFTRELGGTLAVEVILQVDTLGTVEARRRSTRVQVVLTGGT